MSHPRINHRVTVVLSQGQRLGAERQHLEDELVAQLLMSSSAEVTIVGDLSRIDAAGSDQLCLESIAETAVILAWHDADAAFRHLSRIGIAARLLNHTAIGESGVSAGSSATKEFYYYDLNEAKSPEFYQEIVGRVAEESQRAPVVLTNLASGDTLPLVGSTPQPTAPEAPVQSAQVSRGAMISDDDESESRDELDDLMDELDRVEL